MARYFDPTTGVFVVPRPDPLAAARFLAAVFARGGTDDVRPGGRRAPTCGELDALLALAEAGLALRESLTIQLMPRVSGCRVCRFATGEHRHDCPAGVFDAAVKAALEGTDA